MVVVILLLGHWCSSCEHLCGIQDIYASKRKGPHEPLSIKSIALAWIDPATYWPNRMKRRHGGENSTNNSTTTGTTTGTTANLTMGRSTFTESRGNVTSRSRKASEWMASSTSIGEYCSHKKKAAKVNDNSLCPRTGTYKNRLGISQGSHMPQQSDAKRPQCALHLWSNKTKV